MENAIVNYDFEIDSDYMPDTYNDDRTHLERRIDREGFIGCMTI